MNLIKNLVFKNRAVWQPDLYQGFGRTHKYFEGWYFKIVDATEKYAFAIIPGISMDKSGERHAFIQILDGKKCTSEYFRFPTDEFKHATKKFELHIGDNFFSHHTLKLNLETVQGNLFFTENIPWSKMLGAQGIMGWYGFVPFMECYHSIMSLNNTLSGELIIDGKAIDFTNGKGYIEKDWGVSFPSAWIWLQSNHFHQNLNDKSISLFASVAKIPWLGTAFNGFIVGFWFEGKLYKFATYNGSRYKIEILNNSIELTFTHKQHTLQISAIKAGTGELIAPFNGGMTGKVSESLQSELHIKFYKNAKLMYEGVGRNAGLEAAGNVECLVDAKNLVAVKHEGTLLEK